MHIIEASILLIVLVIFSNVISHYMVSIPTALIEIVIGLIVGLLFSVRIELEADWFMLLFVAPLLFNDATHFPKNELWELKAPIFANAIWLVLLTTVCGGVLIYNIVDEISLPLSLALAAVLSPTDPVAVQGIAERVKLPKRILSLISGESLINDASGLITFKYALAACITGQFSLVSATGDFLYKSIVGALIGYFLMRIIHFIRLFLVQQGIRDVILHTSIQITTPFIIYILADEFAHTSGVIAVVTAGVFSIRQLPIFRTSFSEVKIVTNRMWEILVYLLNGTVFIILGAELPIAMSDTLSNSDFNNGLLIFYIVCIWMILIGIRVIWSYMYLWVTYLRKKQESFSRPEFRTALLTGLTGVRGAVTMATVMSIPLYLPNGGAFPDRSLVIFLACGVILFSLLVATITLPLLTKKRSRLLLSGDNVADSTLSSSDEHEEKELTEIEARIFILKHAIQALKNDDGLSDSLIITDLVHEFSLRLRYLYREQNTPEANQYYFNKETEIRLIALAGEKKALTQLLDENQISTKSYKYYKKLIVLKEGALRTNTRHSFWNFLYSSKRKLYRLAIRFVYRKKNQSQGLDQEFIQIGEKSAKGAIAALKEYKKSLTKEKKPSLEEYLVTPLLAEYRNKIERIKHISKRTHKEYKRDLREYYLQALEFEREGIQILFEGNKISLELANHLRQSVNYSVENLLQESN